MSTRRLMLHSLDWTCTYILTFLPKDEVPGTLLARYSGASYSVNHRRVHSLSCVRASCVRPVMLAEDDLLVTSSAVALKVTFVAAARRQPRELCSLFCVPAV